MSTQSWFEKQIERRRQDRPTSETTANALAETSERLRNASAARSELLADEAEENRAHREYRAAVGAAMADVLRADPEMPRGFVEAAMARKKKRLDGTTTALEDRTPDRNVASDTNNANDITH